MSLSPTSETDASQISLFSETASEQVLQEIKDEFPDCPFNVDIFENSYVLDFAFTDEPFILIYDDRLNYIQPNFEKMTELEKHTFRHYTLIQVRHEQPITLRQIINTMRKTPHYHMKKIEKLFGHYYLEKFERRSSLIYEACWGH